MSYLFLAMLGLRCFVWSFSALVVASRTLCCGVWASYCAGFSCCQAQDVECTGVSGCSMWVQELQRVGSECMGFSSGGTGSVGVVHGLICSAACRIFLDQASNPPALAGRFLSTVLPGKSRYLIFEAEFVSFLFSCL